MITRRDRRTILACGILLTAIWGGIATDLKGSVFLDDDRYDEALYAAHLMQGAGGGAAVSFDKESAEAYWACYPDVGRDSYFGASGPLGILGAREHYERHGRSEGRIWPLVEDDCAMPASED